MAIKIEWVLILLIGSIIDLSYKFKINQTSFSKTIQTKDLEFYDTVFSKVDTKELISKINTTYGFLESNVLTLKNIQYQDKSISKLLANSAIKYDNIMYLEGDISVYQVDDFRYYTQKAVYDKSKNTFISPVKFYIVKKQDYIDGEKLIYHLDKKVVNASKVHAIIEIVK